MGKGKCYICNKTYSNGGLTRHLKSCLIKVKGAEIADDHPHDATYLIKVQYKYNGDYYLYLMVNGCVYLSELDQYLRDIWLECCNHLSLFTIYGTDYERYTDPEWYSEENMFYRIMEVLDSDTSFLYEYDYGSTTELKLNVMGRYKPLPGKAGIYLVGRNLPIEYKCDNCDKSAKFRYYDMDNIEPRYLCGSCNKKAQTEELEEKDVYISEILNSPRHGTCGYYGPADDILFMEHKPLRPEEREERFATPGEEIVTNSMDDDNNGKLITIKNLGGSAIPSFIIENNELGGRMLKDHLSLLRRTELNEIGKKLNIKKTSALNKSEFINLIEQFLFETIEDTLLALPLPIYYVLERISKKDDILWENMDDIPQLIMELCSRGLLFVTDAGWRDCVCIVPDDVKIAIKRLSKDVEFRRKRELSSEIYGVMTSVFFYWGIIKKNDLKKEVKRLLDTRKDVKKKVLAYEQDEFNAIFDMVFQALDPYVKYEVMEEETYYYMFAKDVEEIIANPKWGEIQYPLITEDMIPEENDGWASLVLHSPYFNWMYEMIKHAEEDEISFEGEDETEIEREEETRKFIFQMVFITMNLKPGAKVRELARELEMYDEIFSVPFMREFLNNILIYTPNYWLKGNSVAGEIHVRNDYYKEWEPKILNPRGANGIRKQKSVKVAATKWKLGRNDLCPCGSGKKFKDCCGGLEAEN